jgi:hypothetical protein
MNFNAGKKRSRSPFHGGPCVGAAALTLLQGSSGAAHRGTGAPPVFALKPRRVIRMDGQRFGSLRVGHHYGWKRYPGAGALLSNTSGEDNTGLRTTTEIVGFVKDWEIIADNLSKAGWSYGYVSALDREGRTIWIVGAHRGGSECKAVFQSARLRHVESERQMMACENDDPHLRHGLVNRTLPVVAV